MFCRTEVKSAADWNDATVLLRWKMKIAKTNHLEKNVFCEETLLTFLSQRTWLQVQCHYEFSTIWCTGTELVENL